jgi:hypothetical protein
MDEHRINMEKSKLQYDKISSNVKRIVEENHKISVHVSELEKEMVLVISNVGAPQKGGN